MLKINKAVRFISIYGLGRTLNKIFGRLRPGVFKKVYLFRRKRSVSIVGCGQFSFSTICFFVAKNHGRVFLGGFDVDQKASDSLTSYYGFTYSSNSFEQIVLDPGLDKLFIASNHASHTPYAVAAMKAGVRLIHIEKPIAVTMEQLVELVRVRNDSKSILYAGYNRPYSKAIRELKNQALSSGLGGAFSLNFFISGHDIPENHWYRLPSEGTRVCGNLGHWLDLVIHIFAWRGMPNIFKLQIACGDESNPDDNMVVSIVSDFGDIVSIMLTARSEPFEGINESLNFQYKNVIAKIDDFREMIIWKGAELKKYKYFPKDVGHSLAVNQMFNSPDENREWDEVALSTLLMLFIVDMVKSGEKCSDFVVSTSLENLKNQVLEKRSF